MFTSQHVDRRVVGSEHEKFVAERILINMYMASGLGLSMRCSEILGSDLHFP